MNYAPATFWYAFPNVKWNVSEGADGAKQKVVLQVEDIMNLE